MNTPAHLVLGLAFFGHRARPRVNLGALAGGLAPDLSLFALTGVSLFVLGIPAERVFGTLYYSDGWQAVFAVDNSFLLWGAGLAVALWRGALPWISFALSGLLHLLTDFLLHGRDARAQFWPLSDWKYSSPVSYWDPTRYAGIVAPLEVGVVTLAALFVFWRHGALWVRLTAVALCLAEVASLRHWLHFMG